MYYFDWATFPLYPKEISVDFYKLFKKPIIHPYKNVLSYNKETKKDIDKIREKIAFFINAKPEEIFFTKSATDSLAKIIKIFNKILEKDEEILYNYDNHIKINKIIKDNLKIKKIDYNLFPHSGDVDWRDINKKITKKTRLIFINHLHGIYGLLAEPEKIEKNNNHILIGDISHSISRTSIDIKKTKFDIAFFSSYKIFGMEGAGICYLSERVQKIFGKKNITNFENWDALNVTSILSLKPAINFFIEKKIKKIKEKLTFLTQYFINNFRFEDNIDFLPGAFYAKCATGYGIISFRFKNIPSIDLVNFFEKESIYVRISNHCYKKNEDFIRVSFHFLTKEDQIDYLVNKIKKILFYK